MRRRTWFDWHSWLGLTAGLLLFVVCWSGTVAVFSRELDWAADSRMRAPAAPDAAIPWAAVEANVRAARPGWSVEQINAPAAPGFAVEAGVRDPEGLMRRVFADPATGAVLGGSSYCTIQRFFRSLHMSLFIGEWRMWGIPFGYLTVGLLSLPLLGQLVTGLLFYRRFWRGFFHLRRRKGAKVFWSDAHKLSGVWAIWFVILIGLTGVWYLAEWKVTSEPHAPSAPVAKGNVTRTLPLAQLIARARAAYPALTIREVALYDWSSGMVAFHGQDGSILLRDRAARVWLDNRTGEVLGVRRPAEMTPLHRWIDTADPLHFGNFGGLASKVVWFMFGLALTGMCLSGAYLQAMRQVRDRGLDRRGLHAAHAVTLVILACAVAFAVKELRGYGAGDWPDAPAGVWLVVAGWTASTVGALAWWIAAVGRACRLPMDVRLASSPALAAPTGASSGQGDGIADLSDLQG